MTGLLRRAWLPTLIVVAVVIAGVTVDGLRSVFGSNAVLVTPTGSADTAEDFNPKVVTYEVFGAADTAVINYLDLEAKPQRVASTTLPWSLTLRTTAPAATPSILAQGDGHGISCRITVDNELKDERSADGVNAMTFCLVKSA